MRHRISPSVLLLLLLLASLGCSPAAPQKGGLVPLRSDFAACQGGQFRLDVLGVLDALPDDTPAAQREQLRDWIWTGLLSRIAARQGEPELLAGISRQPLIRDEAFSHLLDLPVGRSRTATGKDGTVYLLVDRTAPARIYQDVLEAVDQESLPLGEAPSRAVIYGLDLRLERGEAEICQLGAVDRAWLQAPEQGYRRSRIAKAEDLQAFLKGGIDLLTAKLAEDGTLEVAGRQRTRTAAAPVTPQHVASLAGGSGEALGFSLDPRTDVPAVAEHLDQLLAALGDTPRTARLLRDWGSSPDEALALSIDVTRSSAATRSSLRTVRGALDGGDRGQAEAVLAQASQFAGNPAFAHLVAQAVQHSGYQCARYDGPVQGTQAAMSMFYTDLMAKLWAIDWQSCAPTGSVPGFVSIPRHRISLAFCGKDAGVPYTRIWFGARQEGFLREAESALRFAPVTTRLFALGSALGSDHSEEVEPAADMLRFIRWWDRNYARMAEWEPQYELLNQLMKWSLVHRMLESSGSPALSFSSRLGVERSQRFEDWLSSQPGLRLQKPLRFVERADEQTECLDLFGSAGYPQCTGLASLSGGVGLPRLEELTDRPLRNLETEPFARRIESEARVEKTGEGLAIPRLVREKGEIRDFRIAIAKDRVEAEGVLSSRVSFRGDHGYFGDLGEKPADREIHFRRVHTLGPESDQALITQELAGFGWEQLTLDGDKLALQAKAGRRAEQIAYGISQFVNHGEDLRSAARSMAADLPVFSLADHRIAIEFRQAEDEEAVYLFLDGGGGIRGPPPGDVRFTVGAPDPENRGGGPHRGIDVSLARGEEARAYLERETARPVEEASEPVLSMRASLARNDFAGALAIALAPETPPRAVADLAAEAARRRDLPALESLTARLIRHPADLPHVDRTASALQELAADFERRGAREQAQRARTLLTELAVGAAALDPTEADLVLARLEGDTVADFAPPPGFGNARPPVAHPLGQPIPAGERFKTVVVDLVARVRDRPTTLRVASSAPGGLLELERIVRELPASRPVQVSSGSGAPWRRAPGGGLDTGGDWNDEDDEEAQAGDDRLVWPLIVIVPCTVEEDGGRSSLPSCYEPSRLQLAPPDLAIAEACDQNRDGEIETAEEKSCRDELQEVVAAGPRAAA